MPKTHENLTMIRKNLLTEKELINSRMKTIKAEMQKKSEELNMPMFKRKIEQNKGSLPDEFVKWFEKTDTEYEQLTFKEKALNDGINTIDQAINFYYSDMKNLLYYYSIKSILENSLQGERTFKRNIAKFEKTLMEYLKKDKNFNCYEKLDLSIYTSSYQNLTVTCYLNERYLGGITQNFYLDYNYNDVNKLSFRKDYKLPDEIPSTYTADEYLSIAKSIKAAKIEYLEKLKQFHKENDKLLNTDRFHVEWDQYRENEFKVARY